MNKLEIFSVPVDWEHLKDAAGLLIPFKVEHWRYELAARSWAVRFLEWHLGKDPISEISGCDFFWDWHGMPPRREEFILRINVAEVHLSHLQVYLVGESALPVSPKFATWSEMDDWQFSIGFNYEGAEAFTEHLRWPAMKNGQVNYFDPGSFDKKDEELNGPFAIASFEIPRHSEVISGILDGLFGSEHLPAITP